MVQSLIDLLKPVREAADIIQANHCSLPVAYDLFMKLFNLFQAVEKNPAHLLQSVGEMFVKEFNERKQTTFKQMKLFFASKLVSIDYNPLEWKSKKKDLALGQQFILTWGVNYLLKFGDPHHDYFATPSSSKEEVQQQIKSSLTTQLASLLSRQAPFDDIDVTKAAILKEKHSSMLRKNQLFWSCYLFTAPELSSVALALSTMSVSEASVERTFSAQKFTHTDLINQLSSELVEDEMMIRRNYDIISCWNGRNPVSISTNDDDIEYILYDEYDTSTQSLADEI